MRPYTRTNRGKLWLCAIVVCMDASLVIPSCAGCHFRRKKCRTSKGTMPCCARPSRRPSPCTSSRRAAIRAPRSFSRQPRAVTLRLVSSRSMGEAPLAFTPYKAAQDAKRRLACHRNARGAGFDSMCPVRIPSVTATRTKAGVRCASIVPPMNAPTTTFCGGLRFRLLQPYTILGMARIEAATSWTAARAAGDTPGDPPARRPVPAVAVPRRSCGVRGAIVALRLACPTSRRRRGTPSGSVTRFTPLPAAALLAPTRARRDADLSQNVSRRKTV
jgi:hypothetical protein